MPPVEVAAARWRAASSATAPTVSASSKGISSCGGWLPGGSSGERGGAGGGALADRDRLGAAQALRALEPLRADALEPGLVGDALGALADHQHVRRAVEDRPRERDRVADARAPRRTRPRGGRCRP